MGALDITPAEIRQRLVTATALDISDTVAGDASHKLAADAWAGRILTINNLTASDLTDDQAALLKAAKLNYVAIRVVSDMLRGKFRTGPTSVDAVKASDKAQAIKDLKTLIRETLDVAGLIMEDWGISSAGEGDYIDGSEDNRMIDFANTDSDEPLNLWTS